MSKTILCCAECGSNKVQITAWIYANTGEHAGGDPPLDLAWCDECAAEVAVTDEAADDEDLEGDPIIAPVIPIRRS